MCTLESMGTAQNRKVFARHGAGGNTFGVSFADLGRLQKQIKTDQALAAALWKTGNSDARSLATEIADPAAMRSQEMDAWVRQIDYYCHADQFARLVSRSPLAESKMKAWTRSKEEFVGQVGWDLLGILAMSGADLPDSYFEKHLETIEKNIHRAKNRVRHAMNGALIGIGMRGAKLEKLALAAAGRIGKVTVDHGATNCKTPDAAAYIKKAKEYRKRKGRGAVKKV